MTPSDPPLQKPPSILGRAESGSRQVVMHVGLGFVSLVVGSIMSAGVATRFAERLPIMTSPAVSFAFGWVIQRLWLFVLLPLVGWTIGRLTEVKPLRFALTAGLAGELFGVLLYSAINGFEIFYEAPADTLARIVTFFAGLAIVVAAVREGQAAGRVAQAEADAIAAKQKAEYAARLAELE